MIIVIYFKRLLSLWITWVFTGIDILAFIIGVSTPSLVIPAWAYWTIAGVGFVIANILLFAQTEEKIIGYESREANLVINVLKTDIIVDAPVLIVDRSSGKSTRSPDGLYDNGMPYITELLTKVQIENIGIESGEFIWENDLGKMDLPDLFALYATYENGSFSNDPKDKTLKVGGRERFEGHWRIRLHLQEEDPTSFAERISTTLDYKLYLNYRTKRIGGETQKRTVIIEGDLATYRDSIVKKWKARGLDNLVRLAINAPQAPAIG